MTSHSPFFTYATTASVAAEARLAFWDEYNASALIGLRTSSLSESGLIARQVNGVVQTMRIAEIEGNDHSIERNSRLVNAYPKESIFACHLLKGNAYFVQGGQIHTVNAFETIIYDTRRPFTFGFPADMHEFLIEIPATELVEHWGIRADELPMKVVPTAGMGTAVGTELRRSLASYLNNPTLEGAESLPVRINLVLRSMVQACTGGPSAIDPSLFYVLAAKNFIAQKLSDSELTPTIVANQVGVSVRHLNRLFAAEKTSLADYIWTQRITRAHRDLLESTSRQTTISEIAFRWGFSSQAHFCRAISARYGMPPSAVRQSTQPMTQAAKHTHPTNTQSLW